MDIEDIAKQNQFALLIGVSEASVSGYIKRGILQKNGTYQEWLLTYCKRQRLQASNQGGEKQTDLAQARINDLEVKAKLNTLKYYREINELVPLEMASNTISEWAVFANQEYQQGIKKITLELESKYSLSIDEKFIEESINSILKRVRRFAQSKADSLMEATSPIPDNE